jgi:ElaB/YqjD/DUF883 family membrane-anchored ribosome-binding protein
MSQAPGGLPAPDQATEPKRRPWAWIAVCGVLALAVVGLTIWALSLNSDLDHQRDQTAAAQQQAEQAGNQADQLSSQVDQLTQDVNNAIDEAGQAAQGALADLKAKLSALAGQSKPPAGGSGSSEPTATPTAATAAATATAVENATPGTGG